MIREHVWINIDFDTGYIEACSMIHEHIWITVEFDTGYIEVCSICGEARNKRAPDNVQGPLKLS